MTPLVPPFGTRRTGYLGRKPARRLLVGDDPDPPPENPLPTVTHYGNTTAQGTGDGSSKANAFLISDFLALPPGPGDHLQLADGVYTGSDSRILSSTSGNETDRITISAENEGEVRINGGGSYPILISNNYWWLQGFDAHNGDYGVVRCNGENNIFRKMVCWDMSTTLNGAVFDIFQCSGNLIEDCAAFGNGRRMFQSYQSPSGNTFRRVWGMGRRWDSTTKKVIQIGYNGYNDLVENAILTFDSEGATNADKWRGLHCFGRVDDTGEARNSRSKFLGGIAYVLSGQQGVSTKLTFMLDTAVENVSGDGGDWAAGGNEFRDMVVYSEQALESRQVLLRDTDEEVGEYTDITEIEVVDSPNDSAFNAWTVTNRVHYTSVAAANSASANPFQATSGTGARVYYRYVDGVLQDGTGGTTATKLWPWPMDSRINAALVDSGRTVSDVFGGATGLTDLMEDIFGAIP